MFNLSYSYPLPEILDGTMLGNGLLGGMIWGQGNVVNISIGCASLWDHRGGMDFNESQNYPAIRRHLENGDLDGVTRLFASENVGSIRRPSIIPVGRIVVTLPENCTLLRNEIILETGVVKSIYQNGNQERELSFCFDMNAVSGLTAHGLNDDMQVALLSSWEISGALAERGFAPSECHKSQDGQIMAFIQKMPKDPAYAVLLKRNSGGFTAEFFRGIEDFSQLVDRKMPEWEEIFSASSAWWKKYWQRSLQVETGDLDLDRFYWENCYKYAIMTNPAGVPPGLQGPWIEDDKLPQWGSDYHFNINVQICLDPGYKSGLFDHIKPTLDMVIKWKDLLRHNAKCFAGIDDGYMLPHSVDDRGKCMGGFWSGNMDHGCSTWFAVQMYDYCEYSGDDDFLRDEVFDFMKGVLRVWQVMFEYDRDGNLFLPLSVSPEYRGALIDAFGKNASYQLAAIHRLCRNLIAAAEKLNEIADPFWSEVLEKLPLITLYGDGEAQEIALWEDTVLASNHRHHSHFAAIVPFALIDPMNDPWRKIWENSDVRWTALGMSEWVGFSYCWAAQLRMRTGHADSAVKLLKMWNLLFNNRGGNSNHYATSPGFSIHPCRKVMQMDSALNTLSAIQDMFGYTLNDVFHFFKGITPETVKASFTGLHLPGGITVDGNWENGNVKLNIHSERGGKIKISLPGASEYIALDMQPGQRVSRQYDTGVRLVSAKA